MRVWIFVACSAALAGCVIDEPLAVEVDRSALLNGEEQSHPGVGKLYVGNGLCTATLIAPDAALTAAHCLGKPREDTSVSWYELIDYPVVFVLDGESHESYSATIHPDYDLNAGRDLTTIDAVEGDIAVLHFEYWIADRSVPLATRPPQPGDELLMVGFGRDGPDGGLGWSQVGVAEVARVTALNLIAYGPESGFESAQDAASICPGDSGGPSFVQTEAGETLVGVHSTDGPYDSGNCGHESWDIRVDRYRDWVDCAMRSYVGEECGGGKTDEWGDPDDEATVAACSAAPGSAGGRVNFALLAFALFLAARRRR